MFEYDGSGVLAGKLDDHWVGIPLLGWYGKGLVDGVVQYGVGGGRKVSRCLSTGNSGEDDLTKDDVGDGRGRGSCVDG